MSRSRSESFRSVITRKASGILRSPAPPVSLLELSSLANIDPSHPTNTLSYRYTAIELIESAFRCQCGFSKYHIMCLGDLVDKEQKLFNFCGGIFVVKGDQAECSKCRKTDRTVMYQCTFCGKETEIVVALAQMWSRFGSHDLEDITEERVVFSCD